MKTTALPKKFLSRREKNGHRRGRSSDGTQRHRPLSSDAFFSIFKFDGAKQQTKEEDEATRQEKEAAKIEEVRQKVASLDLHCLQDGHIRYALNLRYSSMDVDKAIEILLLQQTSLSGRIISYNPAVRMLGAENRGNVTCYLDALLFAMFAKLESFECMIKREIHDEPRKKLAALLRLWVNMLRSGKLIETDMTQHIQDALADCGWKEARLLEQQDTSEAFAFITETLQLPLLTLQVDLFHHGKNDDADHKVVYERLLNLAIPPDSEGKGVRLEDCLEEYFNSQVDVLRDSLDEKKTGDRSDLTPTPELTDTPSTPKGAVHIVEVNGSSKSTSPDSANDAQHQILAQPRSAAPDLQLSETQSNPESQPSASGFHSIMRPHRSRTESIIQRVVIDEQEKSSDADAAGLFQRAKKTASVVKAVTIPAWQFFKLIPWHSPDNLEPQSDLEVAQHFNQRPVVGICLKRYMVDGKGNMKRQNTYIDIPDSLRLPHFIMDDRHVEESGLTAEYKLVLQSVVCHRGDSLHSGHYISFCRVAPKLLTDNRRHEKDPPPDYEEAQWVKFDDLATERVTTVDDIKQSLKEEMPYLLFYQIVPIVDMAASSTESTEADPPAYDDAAPTVITSDASGPQEYEMVSRKTSSYFDNASIIPSAAPSVRFSAELERSARRSFADDEGYLSVSRRGSITYGDVVTPSSVTTSNDHSPAVSPGEETTAQRLSRAAAKFKSSSKSRPPSQAGENRISQTMTKLGLIKSSREPLQDTAPEDQDRDADSMIVNRSSSGHDEKEGSSHHFSIEKEKESTHRRGKSRTRFDKAKSKDKDVPDRECIVQ
ncbi:cysteine proteinase [Xylariaceae sp. FL1651]|nr:cysteine proteinase [Xylariaceae sp. FL1651]